MFCFHCTLGRHLLSGTAEEDVEAYRDPHSDKASHAADVIQLNIERSAATTTTSTPTRDLRKVMAGEGGQRSDGAFGAVQGTATAAGREASHAMGAARGAAEVAREEASRMAGW